MKELTETETGLIAGGRADFSGVTSRVYSTAQIVHVGEDGGGGGYHWYDFAETIRMANEFFRD